MIMVPGDIFDGGTIIEGPDKWDGVTFVCKYCGMEVYSRTEDLHYHKDGCGCKAAWEALKADIIARGASEKEADERIFEYKQKQRKYDRKLMEQRRGAIKCQIV